MKIFQILQLLKNRYIPTWDNLKTRFELLKYPKIHNDAGPLILCLAVEDYSFAHRIIHFMLAYKEFTHTRPQIGWILPRKPLGLKSFSDKIRFNFLDNFITDYMWTSLYKSVGGKVAFRFNDPSPNKEEARNWARNIKSSLKSSDDLVKLHLGTLHLGDLVNDTYLRYKPAPTVDIADPFLEELLIWTWDLYHQVQSYFDRNQVTALLITYTAYIQHGILTRVALERNVPVYSLGAANQLVVKPTKEFPFHKRNFHEYKKYISEKNMEEVSHEGQLLIENRMSGKIDSATAYMQASAYEPTKMKDSIFGSQKKARALVVGHDFYDSPHIYGDLLFPDFYLWIDFVFSEAQKSSYEFFYKPHPNGLPGNDSINEKLRDKYPHIKFIDKATSNLSIIEEGVDIAFSVYGTVAHEFAYKGIPVVNAGDNPHQIFKFNICAKSKDELAEYVRGNKKPQLDNSDVAEFCYVHSYRYLDGSMSLFTFPRSQTSFSKYFDSKNLTARIESMLSGIRRTNEL